MVRTHIPLRTASSIYPAAMNWHQMWPRQNDTGSVLEAPLFVVRHSKRRLGVDTTACNLFCSIVVGDKVSLATVYPRAGLATLHRVPAVFLTLVNTVPSTIATLADVGADVGDILDTMRFNTRRRMCREPEIV